MNVRDFLGRWSTWYPNTPPFRPSMRCRYPERWVRIHSLPGGKRFAKTDGEREELLRRHNRSGSQVLGEGSTVAIVVTYGNGYLGEHEPDSLRSLEAVVMDDIEESWTSDSAIVEYMGDEVSFAVAVNTWCEGRFDSLLERVGEGGTAPLMFVNLERGGVYSPYDGGADVFVAHDQDLTDIRQLLGRWSSERLDGL